jgi:hypothetical protein
MQALIVSLADHAHFQISLLVASVTAQAAVQQLLEEVLVDEAALYTCSDPYSCAVVATALALRCR